MNTRIAMIGRTVAFSEKTAKGTSAIAVARDPRCDLGPRARDNTIIIG